MEMQDKRFLIVAGRPSTLFHYAAYSKDTATALRLNAQSQLPHSKIVIARYSENTKTFIDVETGASIVPAYDDPTKESFIKAYPINGVHDTTEHLVPEEWQVYNKRVPIAAGNAVIDVLYMASPVDPKIKRTIFAGVNWANDIPKKVMFYRFCAKPVVHVHHVHLVGDTLRLGHDLNTPDNPVRNLTITDTAGALTIEDTTNE